MKRSSNLNGMAAHGRARARHRAFSLESLALTMRAAGLRPPEIRAELEPLLMARPKRWRVYYGDREAAQQAGDPLLGTVEAATRGEAERMGARLPAYRSHVGPVWVVEDDSPAGRSADRQQNPGVTNDNRH